MFVFSVFIISGFLLCNNKCTTYWISLQHTNITFYNLSTVQFKSVLSFVTIFIIYNFWCQMLCLTISGDKRMNMNKKKHNLFVGVKQACSEFLEKQLDPSNCLGIRIFAENHSCESLRKASEAYSFKYFQEVIQYEEFKTLAIKDVECLLKNDEIQVGIISV